MKKNILPILIIIVVLFGMLAAILLSRQQATLRNNAAIPTGTGTVTLNPATGTYYVGNIFPVNIDVNTAASAISSVTFRITYPYTNATPEFDVVDQAGTPITQITPNQTILSSGDWSFPVKSITRANGLVTIDFAALNTNIAGYTSNSPVTFATIYFKVNSPVTGPLTLTFDPTQDKMMTKSNPTDILNTPTNPVYTLLAPTPSPSPSPTPAPLSDLVVTNLTWSPLSATAGNGVTFSATIQNQGTGTSPSGVIHGIAFEVDGVEVTWSDNITTSLAPGASRVQTANGGKLGLATWTATAGTHQITAWVDDANRIPESNESNNTLTLPITVGAAITPSPVPTITPSPIPTASPTPVPTATPTIAPTIAPTPTPTPLANIDFKFKMQGINNTGPNSVLTLALKTANTTVYTSNINIVSNSVGVYTGSYSGVAAGIYDIYLKEPYHLQRKFAAVNIASGNNVIDLTTAPLLAGDFDSNNLINILDIGKFLSIYTALTAPVNVNNKIYDVNNDGVINILDIAVVLSNYTSISVLGD
jgi:hypothetical protein